MRKLSIFLSSLLFIIGSFLGVGFASADPAPSPERPVVDNTGTLTNSDIDKISNIIHNDVSKDDQAQIAVFMTNTIPKDRSLEEASRETAMNWGLGSKARHNGVLLYVAKSDRKMRIETSEGINANLPDILTKDILDKTIAPAFKKGEFNKGIIDGVSRIKEATNDPQYAVNFKKSQEINWSSVWSFLFNAVLVILGLFIASVSTWTGVNVYRRWKASRREKELQKRALKLFNDHNDAWVRNANSKHQRAEKDLDNTLREIDEVQDKIINLDDSIVRRAVAKQLWENASVNVISIAKTYVASYDALVKKAVKKWPENKVNVAPVVVAGLITKHIADEKKRKRDEEERERRRRDSYSSSSSYGYASGGFSSGGGPSSSSSFGGGSGWDGGGSSSSW